MGRRKKREKKGKRIEVNTDGDRLPEEIVDQIKGVADKVGKTALKEVEENPDFMAILRRQMTRMNEPGPEDVFLLYVYGRGALCSEKAIPIPKGEESEIHMLYNYSDGYIDHVGELIYVTPLGIRRLQKIGVIDDKGKILPPFR